jgi:hypothetical protein
MSAVLEIIEQAKSAGIKLVLEDGELTAQGPRPAVEHLLPMLRAHKPELLAALADHTPTLGELAGHWLIVQPSERIEKWFTPPISRSDLESRYPGCLLVPLPDAPDPAGQRNLTPAELDQLARLIPLVAGHYGCSQEELAEMRTAAARDPSGALTSFRAMARELGLDCTVREPERFLTADQWLSLGEQRKTQT